MHPGFSSSPENELIALYQRVYQEEMQGLPICNDNINIEAIDFQLYQDQWLGILITPWFTNLLILRQKDKLWPKFKLGKGKEQYINFPAGDIKFTPRFEPELGSYLCCSLVSPMTEVNSHQQAVNDAKNAMRQLLQTQIEVKIIDAGNDELTEEQLSRRNFFRGKRQLAL